MNADVEIGIVADEAGNVQPHLGLTDQLGFDIVTITLVAEQLDQPFAEGSLGLVPAGKPAVEHGLRQILAPILLEQVGNARQVENIIADCDARPAAPLAHRKDAERQVLDREIAPLSTLAPAFELGVGGRIDHGNFALGKPAHAWS